MTLSLSDLHLRGILFQLLAWMAFLKVFVVAVVCLVQLASCDDSSVTEFKDWKTFKEDLSSSPYMLVDYYASW